MKDERSLDPGAMSSIFVETRQAHVAFQRIDELMKHGWERDYCRALVLLRPCAVRKTRAWSIVMSRIGSRRIR